MHDIGFRLRRRIGNGHPIPRLNIGLELLIDMLSFDLTMILHLVKLFKMLQIENLLTHLISGQTIQQP